MFAIMVVFEFPPRESWKVKKRQAQKFVISGDSNSQEKISY
jgi:hypothetical protein